MENKGIVSFECGIDLSKTEFQNMMGGSLKLPKQKEGFEYYYNRGNTVYFRSDDGRKVAFTVSSEYFKKLEKGNWYSINAKMEEQKELVDLLSFEVARNN